MELYLNFSSILRRSPHGKGFSEVILRNWAKGWSQPPWPSFRHRLCICIRLWGRMRGENCPPSALEPTYSTLESFPVLTLPPCPQRFSPRPVFFASTTTMSPPRESRTGGQTIPLVGIQQLQWKIEAYPLPPSSSAAHIRPLFPPSPLSLLTTLEEAGAEKE